MATPFNDARIYTAIRGEMLGSLEERSKGWICTVEPGQKKYEGLSIWRPLVRRVIRGQGNGPQQKPDAIAPAPPWRPSGDATMSSVVADIAQDTTGNLSARYGASTSPASTARGMALAAVGEASPRPVVRAAGAGSRVSKGQLWAGRILTAIPVLFLAFDSIIKLARLDIVTQSAGQLGWPAEMMFTVGVIEFACLVLYVIPRTSVLGVVLLTGYLGGAIATHVRLGNPFFSHQFFPVYVAAMLWGGLYLREPLLRALLPLRRAQD
jgi:hypothetical protein